jgi:hypothetical protein
MFIILPANRSTLTSGAIDQWHVGECCELLIWFFIDHEWEMGDWEKKKKKTLDFQMKASSGIIV